MQKRLILISPLAWLSLLGGGLIAANTSQAQTVNAVSFTGSNDYIYDGDETDGDALTNRHIRLVAANVTLPAGGTYRVLFDILNPANASLGSVVGSITAYTPNVAFDVTGSLNPSSRLLPHTDHRLQARLQQLAGTNWVTLATSTSVPRQFWHFTNTANGDIPVNVIATETSSSYGRTHLLETSAGTRTIHIPVNYTLRRYDDFGLAVSSSSVSVRFNYELRDDLGNLIHSGSQDASISCPSRSTAFPAGLPIPIASETSGQVIVMIDPPTQLASASRTYNVKTTISHIESGAAYTAGNSVTLPNQRMLHFNGLLACNDVNTLFVSLGNAPAAGAVTVPYVATSIAIDPNSGALASGYTFGGGPAVNVRLHDDGHAELLSGSFNVNGPSPDIDTINNVTFQRGQINLHPAGAVATITATLPAGVGYATSAASPVMEADAVFFLQGLNQNLDPKAATMTMNGPLFVTEETKPLRLAASSMVWQVAQGRFDFVTTGISSVRKPLLDVLNTATVNNTAMRTKRSNDHWWNGATTAASVTVTATASQGGRLSGQVSLGANAFRSHLPYDVSLAPASPSVATITDDQIDPGSKLAGVPATTLRYEQTCPEVDDCAGAGSFTTTQSLTFANNELTITPDGGLHAVSTINSGGLLGWGYVNTLSRPSQNVETPFTQGNFYAAGHFIRGDQNNLSIDEAPAVISLQGRMPGALGTVEKPGTAAYDAGLADYPGLNFRATSGQQGMSYLCGLPVGFGPYDLKVRSKYYTRQSGVTGIHDAVNGTFPGNAALFGYNFTFTNYGLSFLSNENVLSRTNGAIVVPAPSNFTQALEKISFTCQGSVKEAKVPGVDGLKELDYWNVDFKSMSIKFLAESACNPADARLVIGMETSAAHISENLYGKVGFQPNGQLIRPSDNYANITSEFSLAGPFEVDGPTGETYPISAVRGAYLNHALDNPAGPGFWNVAATINVPFFEDLKAHLHLSGDRDATVSPVYMMGGWPRAGSGTPNYGWAAGANNAKNYFTDPAFDAAHTGYPMPVSVATYRNTSETGAPSDESYLCRAQQSWLDAITFDYPLDWSSAGRNFTGHKVHRNDLFVLNIQHQVDWLTAKNAKLSFGAKYDGLPQVHLSNLFNDKAEEALKDVESFVDATSQQVFDEFVGGVDKLASLLQDQVDDVLNDVLDEGIDQFFDPMCQEIQNALNGIGANNCQQVIDQYIRNNQLRNMLNNLASNINQPTSVLNSINQRLLAADRSIAAITGQYMDGTPVPPDPLGKPNSLLGDLDNSGQAINDLVLGLLNRHLGNVAQNLGVTTVKDAIQKGVNDAKPQLTQLVNQLKSLQSQLKKVHDELTQAGAFVQEIQKIVNDAVSQINGVCDNVADSLEDYVCDILQQDIPNFVNMKDKLRDQLKSKLRDFLYATQFIADIQKAVKDKAYDIKAAYDEAVDSVFAKVRHIIIDVVGKHIATAEKKINGVLGGLSDKIGAGEMTGHAHISGDSIKLLRLDGEISWKVPEELRYNGYFQIKELDSTGPNGCSPPGQPMSEVTCGADNVNLKWIGKGMRGSIGGRFTFQKTEGKVTPLGFGGSLEMTEGELTIGALKIDKFGAAAMFGINNPDTEANELEAYLAATVGAKFQKYRLEGGLFLGRTCTLAPLEMVDPDVASLVGQAPFTGGYAYAEGWFPIYNAGCAFNVTLGAGVGVFYFAEGPTWGGRLFGAVSGEALCLLQIGGSLNLVGLKAGDDFRFKGTGSVFGSIGPCDACVEFNKSIKATYLNGDWDIDY